MAEVVWPGSAAGPRAVKKTPKVDGSPQSNAAPRAGFIRRAPSQGRPSRPPSYIRHRRTEAHVAPRMGIDTIGTPPSRLRPDRSPGRTPSRRGEARRGRNARAAASRGQAGPGSGPGGGSLHARAPARETSLPPYTARTARVMSLREAAVRDARSPTEQGTPSAAARLLPPRHAVTPAHTPCIEEAPPSGPAGRVLRPKARVVLTDGQASRRVPRPKPRRSPSPNRPPTDRKRKEKKNEKHESD